MHISTIIPLLVPLLSLASTAPLEARHFTEKDYPPSYHTTPGNFPVFLDVIGELKHPETNNRRIQLRAAGDYSTAVVDAASPVLALRLTKGVFEAQSINFGYPPKPLGLYGYLGPPLPHGADEATLQEVRFNTTMPTKGEFYFFIDTARGAYSLLTREPVNTTFGLILCPVTADGETYYQLYNSMYKSGRGKQPKGCQNIGLDAFIPPLDSEYT